MLLSIKTCLEAQRELYLEMIKEDLLLEGIGRWIGVQMFLTAEAMTLRFGLLLAQKAGSNRLIVNSDNMEVIDTTKNGGHTAGAAAAVFDDCYFLACDFFVS